VSPLLLTEIVLVLAASILVSIAFHRMKLPAVVGFLLTGILIGPSGFRLVRNRGLIDGLAEVGVVMLLFTIGLEFSLKDLKRIRKDFWIGGGAQVALTGGAAFGVLRLLGLPPSQSVFCGFLVSLSSTVVVLKLFADRLEMDTPQARLSMAILLFQDLAVVPMIALAPLLGNVEAVPWTRVLGRLALNLLAVTAVFLAARAVMPKLLYGIVRTRVREVFVMASLGIGLGMALLTSSLGLSLALGAFLAGIIISESEYSHQMASAIVPFKDVFNSIFFISIGMLLDLGPVWKDKYLIILLVLAILAFKAFVVTLTVRLLGHDPRIALVAGLCLAQVGEFSFVLARVGRANDLLPDRLFQVFIASSILTMMAAPFLIRSAPQIAEAAAGALRWRGGRTAGASRSGERPAGHVVIAGFGLNGRNLARVLGETGIRYVVLEINPDSVRQALDDGEPVIFGDVSSRDILLAAGMDRAKAVVFAISDPHATRRAVKIARELGPEARIIVRTRYAKEIDELYGLGADAVIPEEFETSIEIFSRVLEEFHVPGNIVDAQIKVLRGERYGLLRGEPSARPSMEKISDLLSAGVAETYFVKKGSGAAGKTLASLDLRRETGATVVAIVREDECFASPAPDMMIRENDTLVLMASHRDMSRALKFLG
jgi:monovalent cation:H+ antiporter-2, CPA2 family